MGGKGDGVRVRQFIEEYLSLLDECLVLAEFGERKCQCAHHVGEVSHPKEHEDDNEYVLEVVDR